MTSSRLRGILVGYGKLYLKRPEGSFLNDAAHIHLDVVSDFWVFRPEPGCVLSGAVAKKSATHVSCFVHGCFTVSCYRPEEAEAASKWLGKNVKLEQV